jgi:hypothetical protein
MGSLTNLQCDRCDDKARVMTGTRFYVLDDGSKVPVVTTAAFCSGCKAVVEAEVIPVPEAVDALELARQPEGMMRWRKWRNVRKGPPRCLVCGSSQVHLPEQAAWLRFREDQEAAAFVHPGCGGMFRVKNVGLAMISGEVRHNAEGDKL